MTRFWLGFVAGIVVSAVGINGLLAIFDRGVETVRTQATQLAE